MKKPVNTNRTPLWLFTGASLRPPIVELVGGVLSSCPHHLCALISWICRSSTCWTGYGRWTGVFTVSVHNTMYTAQNRKKIVARHFIISFSRPNKFWPVISIFELPKNLNPLLSSRRNLVRKQTFKIWPANYIFDLLHVVQKLFSPAIPEIWPTFGHWLLYKTGLPVYIKIYLEKSVDDWDCDVQGFL